MAVCLAYTSAGDPESLQCPYLTLNWCLRRFLIIIGRDPSVSKPMVHVDIFWFFFIDLRYVLYTYYSTMMGNFHGVLNLKRLFLKLNHFVCKYIVLSNQCRSYSLLVIHNIFFIYNLKWPIVISSVKNQCGLFRLHTWMEILNFI